MRWHSTDGQKAGVGRQNEYNGRAFKVDSGSCFERCDYSPFRWTWTVIEPLACKMTVDTEVAYDAPRPLVKGIRSLRRLTD